VTRSDVRALPHRVLAGVSVVVPRFHLFFTFTHFLRVVPPVRL
jgi:hypothetical protein